MKRSLTALAGAILAFGGSFIVQGHPTVGHALLAIGMVAFAAVRSERVVRTDSSDEASSSRAPLVGLFLLALAVGASIAGATDRLVLAGWLAGCILLLGGLVASRLRFVRSAAWRGPDAVAITFLAVAAAAVNLYRLEDFPPAVHGDVGEIALTALAMDVPRDLFRTTTWWGMPGLHNALQRLGFVFADGLVAARLTDVAFGVLSVVPLAAIVRDAVGLPAALVTGLLAIGSANMINTWRLGVGLGPPPFLVLLAVWALLRAVRTAHSPRDFFFIAGVAAGLSVQVNLSARIVPVVLVCFALHELAFGSRSGRRRVLRGFGWTVGCALLIAGPLLWHYVQAPELLQPRAEKFVLSDSGLRTSSQMHGTDSTLGVVWAQAVRGFGMFHYFPEGEHVGFFEGDGGFFEPPTAALFVLGLAAAVPRFRDRRFGWPIIGWTFAALLVAATIFAPSYHRAGPAAALALVIVGFGAGSVLHSVERSCAGIGLGRAAARVAVGATASLIAASGFVWGIGTYFFDHCQRQWKLTDSTEIARRIAAEPSDRSFTYLLTAPVFYFGYGNIRFMARDHSGKDLQPGEPPPQAAELFPGVNLFIALPHRIEELRSFSLRLPAGTWEEHYKKSPRDQLEFLVLRIEVPGRAGAP